MTDGAAAAARTTAAQLWMAVTAQSSGRTFRGEVQLQRRGCWVVVVSRGEEQRWCSSGCGGGVAAGSWQQRGCWVVAAA
jgi:hypothetical protein